MQNSIGTALNLSVNTLKKAATFSFNQRKFYHGGKKRMEKKIVFFPDLLTTHQN